jgi:hypothetical protein
MMDMKQCSIIGLVHNASRSQLEASIYGQNCSKELALSSPVGLWTACSSMYNPLLDTFDGHEAVQHHWIAAMVFL